MSRSAVYKYWCVLVVCSLAVASANAGQLVNVYRAEALVKSQTEAERNAAARATFGQVIVRVSGQRSALDHPAVKQAINNAQNYLFGFTYQSSNQKITDKGKVVPAVKLQLNYSPEAIDQLLRKSQLPLWPAQRPKILVWLVAQDQTGLRLVPEPQALQALQTQAAYRGLPIIIPTRDMEDSVSLGAEDLWTLDVAKIQDASVRYKADAILVGRYTPYLMGPIPAAVDPDVVQPDTVEISPEPHTPTVEITDLSQSDTEAGAIAQPQGPWVGKWHLLQGASRQIFADETPEVAGLFESAIDQAADYFAAQYAIVPTNQGPQIIVLRIGNISDFGDFKRAQRYLRELPMVRRMEVLRVNSDSLLIALTTEGDLKLLTSTLALGTKLSPVASETMPVFESDVGQADIEQSAAINSAAIDASNVEELDPVIVAELEAALAAEQGIRLPAPAQQARSFAVPANAGTNEDPLLYQWQGQ